MSVRSPRLARSQSKAHNWSLPSIIQAGWEPPKHMRMDVIKPRACKSNIKALMEQLIYCHSHSPSVVLYYSSASDPSRAPNSFTTPHELACSFPNQTAHTHTYIYTYRYIYNTGLHIIPCCVSGSRKIVPLNPPITLPCNFV